MQYLLPLKAIALVVFGCRNAVPMSLLIQPRDQFQVPKSLAHWLHHPSTLHSKQKKQGKYLYFELNH